MGYFFVIVASIMYGIGPTFSAILQRSGWNAATILFEVELVACIFLFIMIRIKRVSLKVTFRQLRSLIVIGGGTYLLMSLLLQLSYRYILAGLCTVFHFIYPIIVMLIMGIFFHEKITLRRFVGIAGALIGIFMIVDVGEQGLDQSMLYGFLLAGGSGVAYAIFVVANDKSCFARLNTLVSTFYILLTGTVVIATYLLATRTFAVSWDGYNPVYAVAYPMSTMIALVSLSYGVHRIGATRTAMLNMLEPVVSMLVSMAVFGGENVTVSMGIGCVVVLLSVVFVNSENRAAKEMKN